MISVLHENPVLVLFLIIAVGYVVGKIRIGGFSLGVAAVLFAGLGISAYDAKLALPQIVYILGLVLFVYTIGLASGPGFVSSLRAKGLRTNGFILGVLIIAALVTVLLASIFNVPRELAVGMYAGAFTNTPALATALDTLQHASVEPVVGYSLAYPLGILGTLTAIFVLQKLWKVEGGAAALARKKQSTLYARTVRYTRSTTCRVDQLAASCGADISVSRLSVNGDMHLAELHDELWAGSLLTIVGNTAALEKAAGWIGETIAKGRLELNNTDFHTRRVFLSNRKLAGRRLGRLQLQPKWGVIVTRIRRGDVDMVAHDDMMLELGDRVKLVGPYKNVQAAADYLGDSYASSSELHILSFTIGIGLGIIVGLIPIPLPGGGALHLGAAGGTLLVALTLGAVGRTKNIVWQLPFSTNTTLRQLGLMLFLAGIGSQAGGALKTALASPESLKIIAIGAVLTLLTSFLTLIMARKLLAMPFWQSAGMLAGAQTQPAVLAYTTEQMPDQSPNIGYASVYPTAMIAKIIIAQILLAILAG
jgi:putative transport protein